MSDYTECESRGACDDVRAELAALKAAPRSDADYIAGLREAHRLLAEHQKRLEREYRNTPGALFGLFPTRLHWKIIGASDALVSLGFELVKASQRETVKR